MRKYLADNALKLVAMAAAIDIFFVLLRDFGLEYMVRPEDSIARVELLGKTVSLVGLISVVSFWMAFGAVAVRVEALYRASRDATYRQGD